jgi:predicted nucleotidyltransferase component of viral defense system
VIAADAQCPPVQVLDLRAQASVVRAREWGLTEEIIEKDYVLGWLLWGIGSHPTLREHWVFKGGTCLKKCFVETYRFSEDLDFTVRQGGPLTPDDLLPVLVEMLDLVEQETGITLSSRQPVVRLRPDGRSAEGRIYYRGPRGAPGEARVKLDLTYDETIVEATVRRVIAHAYDEALPGDGAVQCYAFVEVFAEKLRALGQRLMLRWMTRLAWAAPSACSSGLSTVRESTPQAIASPPCPRRCVTRSSCSHSSAR